MTTTILSRATRAKAKTLSVDELKAEKEYCEKMAIKWLSIPQGVQQANKYFDAVTFYEDKIKSY